MKWTCEQRRRLWLWRASGRTAVPALVLTQAAATEASATSTRMRQNRRQESTTMNRVRMRLRPAAGAVTLRHKQ